MLQNRSAAAGKAPLRAILLRTSWLVALAAETPAAPTQPAAVKLSLNRGRSRVVSWACSLSALMRVSPGEREEEEEKGVEELARAGQDRGGGGGGAGGTGESRDARLAKQEMPARRARPTVRGLNTAGEEEREGPAQVRCERGGTRPSRPPLGGAGETHGGGAARDPRGRVHAAVRRVGARTKGARGGGRCGEGRSKVPLGSPSLLPLARRGMNGGKWGELTSQGLTERR